MQYVFYRGSPHIHGVLWLNDAPKFHDLTTATEEQLQEIANYFDKYISTENPDIECPPAVIHPSRTKLSEVVDIKKDLAQLLNRVQRHTRCTEGNCLRFNKKSKKTECRFKFPKDLQESTKLVITEDNDVELLTARNDPKLNKYNEYMIAGWRANLDVSPVLSRRALVNYLTKYISKSETKSKDLTDILQLLIAKNKEDTSAKSVIQQLYIQACCERDISAQETCHLLNGLPLVSSGGRKFVTLNLKVLDEDTWVPVDDPSQQRSSKSFIEKYMERDDMYCEESLWTMARTYILPSGRKHARGKEAIVQVFPKLSRNSIETNPEPYYRQQVLLFVPWKYEDQFLEKFGSWENAYIQNKTVIESAFHPECDLDNVEPNESEFEEIDIDETITTEQWMSISKMGPSQNAEQVELGRRDLDVNFDWHEASQRYDRYGGIDAIRTFVQNTKSMSNTSQAISLMPNVQFTPEQETVLKLLKMQIAQVKNKTTQNIFALPKSVIVQGKAGKSKTPITININDFFCVITIILSNIFRYRQKLAYPSNENFNS